MAHPPETRQQARNLYVQLRLPLERIASELGVAPSTLASWKRKAKDAGDDWERARNAARVAEGGMGEVTSAVMQDFVMFAESIIPEINASELSAPEKVQLIASFSDSWAKFLRVMGRASPEMAKLAVAMETLELFAGHVRKRKPELLPALVPLLEEIGPKLSSRFGSGKVGDA